MRRDNYCKLYLYKHSERSSRELIQMPPSYLSGEGRSIIKAKERQPGFEHRSVHVGFVVDKVALGQVFSEYFRFPCQFSFYRLLHIHHLSSRADKIGQLVGDVPSGLFHPTPRTKKKNTGVDSQSKMITLFRIDDEKAEIRAQHF
jgi:hypothetical protein